MQIRWNNGLQRAGLRLCLLLVFSFPISRLHAQNHSIAYYNGTINFSADSSCIVPVEAPLSAASVRGFYRQMNAGNYKPIIDSLLAFREKHKLSDWLYYQLIRKTAGQLSPKNDDYTRYTLYKWFLLCKSGYDARLAIGRGQIIFYVRNEEDISDIPYVNYKGNKYTCLNYHDYGKLFERENTYKPVDIAIAEAVAPFSYKVTQMPDFTPDSYEEKELAFQYRSKAYHFRVKVNREIPAIFANYPGVDFETYFNIPLSHETYQSLIPVLRKHTRGMSQSKGVDYLMRFTRYAFLYQSDDEHFGKEKRLSPEQTLSADYSDCDDRAALFFMLVKEIYDLPMIALLYPTHITLAVGLDKPAGKPVMYKGKPYTIREATPQRENLKLGQVTTALRNTDYEIVYQYTPNK
ncbi:hypothetical protein [Pedobacter sp. SYP-B3415]|uniref:hypothetical protein n=1 Tax=Pedobacter sp. SYP-B3415 TaxID=2496641 RepID=UPI001F10A520|nr:hypothetical protein [Pedobacter sp. SYP-B3415]